MIAKPISGFVLVTALAAIALADRYDPKKVEEKKTSAERMDGHERGKVYSEICLALAEKISDDYEAANVSAAQASIKDLRDYARKAADSAKLKGKHIKRTEINLRKCSRRLEEISRMVISLERPPLIEAVTELDKLQDELLAHMFRKN